MGCSHSGLENSTRAARTISGARGPGRVEQNASTIGERYRHLTPQMQASVLVVIDRCLTAALAD
jgi:hypothetical protein